MNKPKLLLLLALIFLISIIGCSSGNTQDYKQTQNQQKPIVSGGCGVQGIDNAEYNNQIQSKGEL